MGFFEFVFGTVDILAVVAFVFATLFITSFLKSALRQFPGICFWLDNDFAKVCLSWAVGAVVFIVMHLTLTDFPALMERSALIFRRRSCIGFGRRMTVSRQGTSANTGDLSTGRHAATSATGQSKIHQLDWLHSYPNGCPHFGTTTK
jgi:hypothetical protein